MGAARGDTRSLDSKPKSSTLSPESQTLNPRVIKGEFRLKTLNPRP